MDIRIIWYYQGDKMIILVDIGQHFEAILAEYLYTVIMLHGLTASCWGMRLKIAKNGSMAIATLPLFYCTPPMGNTDQMP